MQLLWPGKNLGRAYCHHALLKSFFSFNVTVWEAFRNEQIQELQQAIYQNKRKNNLRFRHLAKRMVSDGKKVIIGSAC